MPAIRKIKREQLAELGDEFDVLTDQEMEQSGLTVEADEVIVVAKPAPVLPPSGDGGEDQAATLRARLHTVNQESAARRISLRESEAKIKQLQEETNELRRQVAEKALADAKSNAASLFTEYVKEKKLVFISDEAGKDVQDAAFSQVDWTKPVTKEILGPIVDQAVDKKKYVLRTVELPRTDGGQHGDDTSGVIDIDLEQIAQEFNLPYKKESES